MEGVEQGILADISRRDEFDVELLKHSCRIFVLAERNFEFEVRAE